MSGTKEQVTLVQDRAPPPDYYAQNLSVLVHFVLEQYDDLLDKSELDCANAILDISPDGLRLFARIVGRKGPVFFVSQMNYGEIEDRDAALSELESRELIDMNPCLPADELLARVTIPQLKSTFPNVTSVSPKSRLIESILGSDSEGCVRAKLKSKNPWFCLSHPETLDLFRLLFFGDRVSDLSSFVIRDLGIVEYESYRLDRRDRQFASRGELDTYLEWTSLSDAMHEDDEIHTVDQANVYVEALSGVQENRTIDRYRSRILNSLGRILERAGRPRLAIKAYRRSSRHPARERMVRVLYRSGRRQASARIQARIVESPWSKEEEQFGMHFPSRRKRTVSFEVDTVDIQESPAIPIEQYALQLLGEEETVGWHLENALPLTLFGLVYWNWMFASVPGAFTNPFQTAPRDLFWSEFIEVRQRHFEDPLNSQVPLITRVLETAEAKRGKANRLVSWDLFPDARLERIVNALGESSLTQLINSVKSDLRQFRSGFPDLTVIYSNGKIGFIEVKAPGDQIQRNQRIWLEELAAVSIPARVMRFVISN